MATEEDRGSYDSGSCPPGEASRYLAAQFA